MKAKFTLKSIIIIFNYYRYFQKEIIKDATGYAEQGDALFVMGSSGAGKTTLLNIISDHISSSSNAKLTGSVRINDEIKVTQQNFGSFAAYVTQDDYLFESFTCYKWIEFAARLKLNLPKEEVDQRIEDIIHSLGLNKWRNTIVGNYVIKGLSGGEKKRTAIAVELVTNPKILFLDEPTSGLDSFTAQKIVSLLIDFAKNGKTVIATIHQPNSETFQMFPKLLLLMDGHTIYHGDTMKSVGYFRNLGYSIPEFSNPADYFLKEFYAPFPKTKDQEEKVERLANAYQEKILPVISSEMERVKFDNVSEKDLLKSLQRVNWLIEFWYLMSRAMYNIFYHPMIIKFKTISYAVLGLLGLSIFWNPGDDIEGVRGTIGALYFIIWHFSYAPIAEVIPAYSAERPVFLREYLNKTYGILSYSLSKALIEYPFDAFYALIFSLIVYFGIGLDASFENFIIFYLALLVNDFCWISIGLVIASSVQNEEAATFMQDLFMAPVILFSGVPVNLGSVYPWLRWITYLSPVRYTMEILVRNEYGGRTLSVENPIDSYDFNLSIGFWFTMLIVLSIVLKILSIIIIKLRAKR